MPAEESILSMDRLRGQTTEQSKARIKEGYNSLVWPYPGGARPHCSPSMQPLKHPQVEVGKQLSTCALENGDIRGRWESNAF